MRIPAGIPIKARGFINQGSGLPKGSCVVTSRVCYVSVIWFRVLFSKQELHRMV